MRRFAALIDGHDARRLCVLSGFAVILLLFLILPAPPPAPAFVVPAGPRLAAATSKAELKDVAFPDARHGWAVGDEGTIRATTDGGATWQVQRSGTSEALRGVAFADARHGWVVGDDAAAGDSGSGIILATADGGATWNVQSSGLENVPEAVSCVDTSTAWVAAWNGVLSTKDGGVTWTQPGPDYADSDVTAVTFVDAAHGWAIANGFHDVMATQDGGVTWTTEYSQTDGYLRGITFVDASHGWAVGDALVKRPSGRGRVQQGLILATSDGGASWRPQEVEGEWGRWQLFDVAFADARHGWAVGTFTKRPGFIYSGLFVGTADGGATWRPKTPPDTVYFYGVAAADAAHGWAVGWGGSILSTTAYYGPPSVSPTITGFAPAAGRPGTVVTLSGSGFRGARWVKFNGTTASFKVVSAARITATVPAQAKSGAISAANVAGIGFSGSSFTVR